MGAGDDAARELARQLVALALTPDAQARAAARSLAQRSPGEAVGLLDALVVLGRTGWTPASAVLPAFLRALALDDGSIPHAALLRQVAALGGLVHAEALLAEGEATRVYQAEAAARADARLFSLPLGHLKARARLTRDPDELSRLAVASDPSVVREALKNPRLTEPLVVRIASRRPARPEPLDEISRSPRWGPRPAVQRALVFNPYLALPTGARLVPLLGLADLLALAADGVVHPSLREQAAKLVEASPRAGRRSD